jgi:hypothetical protein
MVPQQASHQGNAMQLRDLEAEEDAKKGQFQTPGTAVKREGTLPSTSGNRACQKVAALVPMPFPPENGSHLGSATMGRFDSIRCIGCFCGAIMFSRVMGLGMGLPTQYNNYNNYSFPVRRPGVHLDHLMYQICQKDNPGPRPFLPQEAL